MLDASRLAALLAEPDRRRVVAAMVLGDVQLDEICRTSGLTKREGFNALDRLVSGGLVERGSDGSHALLEEAFKMAARAAAPTPGPSQHGDEPDDRRRILDSSIVDGRLVNLPTKRSKRLVVLDHLAQAFEPGEHYGERRVNTILGRYDDDVATLRRWLVDEGFLDRADGEYWRSGGRVD